MINKVSPLWKEKYFAERRRQNGKPFPIETAKAASKIIGAIQFKTRVVEELELMKERLKKNINPTLVFAKTQVIDEIIRLLANVEPERPQCTNTEMRMTNDILDGNRQLMIYAGYTYEQNPVRGWYDEYGNLKYHEVAMTPFHYLSEALIPIVKQIKSDIMFQRMEDDFKDNFVMERDYDFINTFDLWEDAVTAAKFIMAMKEKAKLPQQKMGSKLDELIAQAVDFQEC